MTTTEGTVTTTDSAGNTWSPASEILATDHTSGIVWGSAALPHLRVQEMPPDDGWHQTGVDEAHREALGAKLRPLLAKAYAAGMTRYNSGKINPPTEVQKLDALTSDATAAVLSLLPTEEDTKGSGS
jgi:hypothetical protein